MLWRLGKPRTPSCEAEELAAGEAAHTANQQLEVERHLRLYGQSLAALIRGEA